MMINAALEWDCECNFEFPAWTADREGPDLLPRGERIGFKGGWSRQGLHYATLGDGTLEPAPAFREGCRRLRLPVAAGLQADVVRGMPFLSGANWCGARAGAVSVRNALAMGWWLDPSVPSHPSKKKKTWTCWIISPQPWTATLYPMTTCVRLRQQRQRSTALPGGCATPSSPWN